MKYLLLFAFSFLMNSLQEHPVYMSITEMRYFESHQLFGVEMKLFADDLQSVFEKQHGETIEVGTDREHPEATKYITDYLKTHFKVKVNGKAKEWEFVGRENDDDDPYAIWVYLKIPKVKKPKEIEIQNSILHDFASSQRNIMVVKVGDTIRRERMFKGDATKTLEF